MVPGKKSQVTVDTVLDSPSKLPSIHFVKYKENLALHQKSLMTLFHAPHYLYLQSGVILMPDTVTLPGKTPSL